MSFGRFVLWEAVVYALLLAGGGALGWVKKKSMPSLIAGGISSVVILMTVLLGWNSVDTTNTPFFFLSAISLSLMVVFFKRYNSGGRKFMPSGLMTLLSAGSFLLYLVALIVV